jgi:N-acetylneuraminic acid mutarotase
MSIDRQLAEIDTPGKATVENGGIMFTPTRIAAAVLAALAAATAITAASGASTVPGNWHRLAPEPVALPYGDNVWTGRQLIVFGRVPLTKQTYNPSKNAAIAYNAATNSWRTLSPPTQRGAVAGCCQAVWTGKEMLVFGANLAYDPTTNTWRPLPRSVPSGIVLWTGREAIGWGGGCCGDASSSGAAYNPASGRYRVLPRSPLAPSQRPLGAWTGHELILLVSGFDPDGTPYPARLARAAAYDPATNSWRRLPPLPARSLRFATGAAWDGHELLVVGAGSGMRRSYAYAPATNRWRQLASMPVDRSDAAVLWTGSRLVVWGGENGRGRTVRDGLAYAPKTDRWAAIARAPLRTDGTSVAWTGKSLLVFGGVIGASEATGNQQVWLREGAAFTPTPS